MAGSSVGTFYCKPWDSSTVSEWGGGWVRVVAVVTVGLGQLNESSMAGSSVGTFYCKPREQQHW